VLVVSAVTAGDFWLWNWSLSANHDVVALVSGLTLPPLAAASVLLLVLTVARIASGFKLPAASAMRQSAQTKLASPNSPRRVGAPATPAAERRLVFEAEAEESDRAVAGAGSSSPRPARRLAA
jgi:hypothetical protein